MTICAAALCTPYGGEKAILAVADQRFSWGITSTDAGWKMQTVHRRWFVMFSGPLSPMTAMIDALKTAVAGNRETPLRKFGRQCSRAYREERKQIIETDILAEYDLDSYAEYLTLKIKDRLLYDSITERIKKEEADWNLLFVGFDDIGRPHLFVITEYGKIQWCDAEGFAAIGSGAWTAHYSLARYGFRKFMSRGEVAYGLLAAKFAAESADGVGEATGFVLLTAKDKPGKSVAGLSVSDIGQTRASWKRMPKIPDGTANYLEQALVQSYANVRQKLDDPLKGYIKRSRSRKSEPEL